MTGVLEIAAGIVLIGLAVVLLQTTSQNPPDHPEGEVEPLPEYLRERDTETDLEVRER